MEKAIVIALLEKYFQAETTIAEEQALAAYFQGDGVDPELVEYVGVFSYFQQEAQVSAGDGFGDRILRRLGLPLDGEVEAWGREGGLREAGDAALEGEGREAPVVPMVRQPFRFGVASAAAAIVLVVAGLFLLRSTEQPRMLAENRATAQAGAGSVSAGGGVSAERVSNDHAEVADTYDDPEKALAAVRHALLVVSKNLNQGTREITRSHK